MSRNKLLVRLRAQLNAKKPPKKLLSSLHTAEMKMVQGWYGSSEREFTQGHSSAISRVLLSSAQSKMSPFPRTEFHQKLEKKGREKGRACPHFQGHDLRCHLQLIVWDMVLCSSLPAMEGGECSSYSTDLLFSGNPHTEDNQEFLPPVPTEQFSHLELSEQPVLYMEGNLGSQGVRVLEDI
jgi:hypothetical protein